MAKTIPATTVVPATTSYNGADVAMDVTGGPKRVRDAAMAAWWRLGGAGVSDYCPAAGGLMNSSGQSVSYRFKLYPLNEEDRTWRLRIRAVTVSTTYILVTAVNSGATSSIKLNAGLTPATETTGTITLTGAYDYEELIVSWDPFVAGAVLHGFMAYPLKNETVGIPVGDGSTDGCIQLDERFEDGHPLSVAHWEEVNTMLRQTYHRASGQAIAMARAGGITFASGGFASAVKLEVPQTASGRPLKLVCHYKSGGTFYARVYGTVWTFPGSASWAVVEVTIPGEMDGNVRPALRQVEFYGSGASLVYRLSAWWETTVDTDVPAGLAVDLPALVYDGTDPEVDAFGEYVEVGD